MKKLSAVLAIVLALFALGQILAAVVVISASASNAETVEMECDRLAASPTDEHRVGSGVPFDQLDTAAALSVCEQAVGANPSIGRFKYQLARALQKDGRLAEAATAYESLVRVPYAAAAHNLAGMYIQGSGLTQDANRAVELFRVAASAGFAMSQYQLGIFYATGRYVEQSFATAIAWYEKAAAGDHAPAFNELGFLHERGFGVQQDYAKAAAFYRASAERGYDLGQVNLAKMYLNGWGVEADKSEAAKWYGEAANQGNARAQNELGVLYHIGSGVPRDYRKALQLFLKAAAQGHNIAQGNVGLMYARGLGVEVDYAEAAKWYTAAADQGSAWAQHALGDLYVNGTGVVQDDARAFALYRQSADQGHAAGQNELGRMWAMGRGTERNYDVALELFRKSAAQGNAHAKANIGWLYSNGFGVPRDYTEAEQWYREAAEAKNAYAMSQLGWLYEEGHVGGQSNTLKAYIWYWLAAEGGYDDALMSLGRVCSTSLSVGKDFAKHIVYSIAYAIAQDDFLLRHEDIVKRLVTRSKAESLSEAADWFDKAIQKDSLEAILLLAKLHLEEDPIGEKSQDWVTSAHQAAIEEEHQAHGRERPRAPLRAKLFVGSATEAANLYKRAIAKGSNAARINLGALYELGHGVERNLEKAAQLYREAADTRFNGAAQLGLVRLSLNQLWLAETLRRRRILDANDRAQETSPRDDDIVIESLEFRLQMQVTDSEGRRIFSDNLSKGLQYRVPGDRNDLILWIKRGSTDNVQVRFGSKILDLPKRKGSFGVKLNRRLLARNEPYLIDMNSRDEFLPEETLKKSRITIEATTASSVYVHGENHLIGFSSEYDKIQLPDEYDKIQLPDLDGLTLELRAHEVGEDRKVASIAIDVDGSRVLELRAPPDCLITLRLVADQLVSARTIAEVPENCTAWREGEVKKGLVATRQGDVIGHLQRMPDEWLPIIGGLFGVNRGVGMLGLSLGGQWDAVHRAATTINNQDLRDHGPNSLTTIESGLFLCESEIRLGQVSSARKRLDDIRDRLNSLTPVPVESLINFYQKFGALLSGLGRYAEAERFFLYAAALREKQNQLDNLPRANLLRAPFWKLSGIAEQLGDLDKAIVYDLQRQLLDKVAHPESAETLNSEVVITRLVGLLVRTERRAEVGKLIEYTHREAKREFARDLSEPLQFPLDLSVFEQTFGRVDRSDTISEAMSNLGQVYSWLGRHEEAIPLFQQRARTLRNIFGEVSPQASEALAMLAGETRQAGKTQEALLLARSAFASALRYVTERKFSHQALVAGVDALKPAAFALLEASNALPPTEGVEPKGLTEEAFEASQHLQNSSASVALKAFGARLGHDEPRLRDFLRREQDLTEQIARLDATLVSVLGDVTLEKRQREDEIRQKIAGAEAQMRELQAKRPAKLGELDELTQVKAISSQEVQSLLRPEEALVSFVTGQESTFVFAATREALRWAKVPLSKYALERAAAKLRCGVDGSQWEGPERRDRCREITGATPRGSLPFDLEAAHDLYRQLFGEMEDFIKDKHLLVVLSGALSDLPPHLLVTAPPGTAIPPTKAGYRGVAWLVRQHSITILPSVGSIAALRRPAVSPSTKTVARAPKRYIGLGNPTLAGNAGCQKIQMTESCPQLLKLAGNEQAQRRAGAIDSSVSYFRGPTANVERVQQICPLPETARELACVAEELRAGPHSLRLGDAFTEAAIKRMPLDQYQIIHFATHGLLFDEAQSIAGTDAEPALVMTPPKSPTPGDDGLLTASEIARLKLNADWVVLSACNTAGADKLGSEAMSGIARAFFYAGARTILASHWAVDSGATVLLTTGVFSAMAKSPSIGPAEALRQSMLAMMDNAALAHPSTWAPFVVIGEGVRPSQ